MKKYKGNSPNTFFSNEKIKKVSIFITTFIILFVVCSTGIIPKKYKLNVGDVAPADIKAPRDFIDETATRNKIDKAIINVPLQYKKDVSIQSSNIEKINQYLTKVKEIKGLNIDEKEKVNRLKLESTINLEEEDYIAILKLNNKEINTLSEFLINVINKIFAGDIRANNVDDIKKAQEDLNFYIRNSTMTKPMKEIGTTIGLVLIKPNLYFDFEKTEEMKQQAKKSVEPVVIKKNQNIVLKGEVATLEQIRLMNQAGLLKEKASLDLSIYSGIALLISLIEVTIFTFLYKFKSNIYNSNSKLLIIEAILCINALLSSGANIISGYLIPVGFISILIDLIFDPMTAFIVSIPSIIMVACITNFNVDVILLYLVGSIIGILVSKNVSQRNNVLLGGLTLGLVNGATVFSLGLINNVNIIQTIINSSLGASGGVLSAILSIGILPIFEQLFDINTPIRLLELSNPNQPLLKKMLFEAPGTYHHSILVGNLSEAAAEEVGANVLLSRVGSYYHDIGKIKRPYFFKENQITNDNPHDKINPKLSTLIITSHVKDGIELAVKNKLPRAVREIIEEHHGNTLVRYFYVKAKNEGNEDVEEKSYRYDGPRPSSKESAIVMLADSVEAAVRSISSPSINEIENMVNKIINEKIDDKQLDNSDLTLKDIEKIKSAFIKVLMGIFHNRIEYPEINSDIERKGEKDNGRI